MNCCSFVNIIILKLISIHSVFAVVFRSDNNHFVTYYNRFSNIGIIKLISNLLRSSKPFTYSSFSVKLLTVSSLEKTTILLCIFVFLYFETFNIIIIPSYFLLRLVVFTVNTTQEYIPV